MKVLKFGAVWCNGCLVMRPRWQKIEEKLPWLETEYIDVDEQPETIKKYKLVDYPTFIYLDKKGQEFARMVGEISEKKLIEFLEENREK